MSGKYTVHNRSSRHSAAWPGLLLGFLLTLFMTVFVYVGYQFLALGQSAVASAPKLSPLELPRLVRNVPAAEASTAGTTNLQVLPAAQRAQESAPVLSGRVTILLMGVDARPDEKVSRTDSIIVVTVNPKMGTAGMLSFARDLVVPAPGFTDTVKINTLHVLGEVYKYPGGGPGLLRSVVSEMIGYPIDYYVRLNFDGFRQIIDLIGGIDINVPTEIRDDEYPDENYGFDPLYIPAGRQHMDGALALKYARTRHIDSDYGRARRQQDVILAIREKVMQPGQLGALLPRLPGLVPAMANTVQTDMPVEKALSLARMLGQVDLHNPTQVVVDNAMGTQSMDPEKGFILIPDMPKVRAAAAAVFADVLTGPSAAEAARKVIQGEGARVLLLNGTPEAGLAVKAEDALRAQGYNVTGVGNAERVDYAQTWLVTHGDGKPATREALIRQYGISPDRIRSEPPSDTVDLTVILGSDQVQKAATR